MNKLLPLTAASLLAISGAFAADYDATDTPTTEAIESQMGQGSHGQINLPDQQEANTDSTTRSDTRQRMNRDRVDYNAAEPATTESVESQMGQGSDGQINVSDQQANTKDQLKSQQESDSSLHKEPSEVEVEAEE